MEDINDLTDKIKKYPKPDNLLPSLPPVRRDPVCSICDGIGFIQRSPLKVPVGHPDFGKIDPCVCISTDVFLSFSNLSARQVEKLKWDMVLDNGEAKNAVQEVRHVINKGFGWVYMWGDPGTAKSLILQIAVAEMVKAKRQATYINMSALIDNLREAYDTEYPQAEAIRRLSRWTRIPILCIDEFDKVKGTEYVHERRMRLVDDRYADAIEQKTVTIFASNESPESFDNYLTDRFRDGRFKVVNMGGQSMRPNMLWEKKDE